MIFRMQKFLSDFVEVYVYELSWRPLVTYSFLHLSDVAVIYSSVA